jgi:hypothetical protein
LQKHKRVRTFNKVVEGLGRTIVTLLHVSEKYTIMNKTFYSAGVLCSPWLEKKPLQLNGLHFRIFFNSKV